MHDVACEFARAVVRSKDAQKQLARTDLKKTASAIAPYLGAIFNYCIAEGFWLAKWKMGEWTPAFKMGYKRSKENYRPIRVLP